MDRQETADDEPQGSSSGCGILIVEDDFLMAGELARLLRDRGYQVLGPIPSAAGARAVLQWQHPAAALLDLKLRDGCAMPAAQALAEVGVPFALVTGSGAADLGEPLLQKAPRLGKPYDEAMLLRLLDGLLTPQPVHPASCGATAPSPGWEACHAELVGFLERPDPQGDVGGGG